MRRVLQCQLVRSMRSAVSWCLVEVVVYTLLQLVRESGGHISYGNISYFICCSLRNIHSGDSVQYDGLANFYLFCCYVIVVSPWF